MTIFRRGPLTRASNTGGVGKNRDCGRIPVATFLTIVKFEVYSFNGSRQRHTVYDGMLPLSKMYDTGRYPQWASPNATLVTFWGYRFMHAHSRTCNPASLTRSLPALFPYLSLLRFHLTRPLSQATIEIGGEKWNSTGQSKQCELSSLANSVADGNYRLLADMINESLQHVSDDLQPVCEECLVDKGSFVVPDQYIISLEMILARLERLNVYKAAWTWRLTKLGTARLCVSAVLATVCHL